MIPQIKTPGTYLDVNINTQRTGLPANNHKVLFITNDSQPRPEIGDVMPVDIYDKAQAEQIFGNGPEAPPSEAARMITAAIKTNNLVRVQCLGKQEVPM